MLYYYMTDIGKITCLGDQLKYYFLANHRRIKLLVSVFLS
jgi:hypothetical protein